MKAFVEALKQQGVVGEDQSAKLLLLGVTSRLLKKPVSIAVKGPSSAGKSFLVERVLSFFPKQTYITLTSLSPKALVYFSEPLKHRTLVLCEAAGLSNELANYFVRSLLSEGRLDYETVVTTPEGPKAVRIEREGPTGLIITTTNVKLHAENETRLLSVTLSDEQEQTRQILLATARGTARGVDPGPWHELQNWLAETNNNVSIPFAEQLADLIPPVAVRLRRDFAQLLNLIRAHALLHQASRPQDGDGRIVAGAEDYAEVRDLVAEVIADGIDATVSDQIRQTVEAIKELSVSGRHVTVKMVAQRLHLDISAALRRVQKAVERGYVRNLQTRRNQSAWLVLGEPLPEDKAVLPEAAMLTKTR